MSGKVTISIIDDDESLRESIAALMMACGFDTETFDSAASFLESPRLPFTDCLIADFQMPGLTGLELVDCLAASGRSVPTILITARHEESLRLRALRAGVSGFLRKPFGEDELLSCVSSAVGDRSAAPH